MPFSTTSTATPAGARAERILAVDIGTTATKAVVLDMSGSVLRSVQEVTDPAGMAGGNQQQSPETVTRSVLAALHSVFSRAETSERWVAVVFSAQMYSVLAVDAHNRPLGPSYTWADRSAQELVAGWHATESGVGSLAASSGCPVQALYPLAKIAWMRRRACYAGAVRFVSIKEYVLFRLTGEWLVDWQMASASGLLDIRRLHWSEQALDLAGLGTDSISPLVPVRHRLPPWSAEALATGIPAGVPGVIGGGDGPLGSLGLCAFSAQTVAVNVGTSAAARVLLRRPVTDPQGRLWTYAVDHDLWVIGGLVSSCGAVFSKVCQLLGAGVTPEQACIAAGQVQPGADGLLFMPELGGSMSPDWRPQATGSLHGLTFAHHWQHIARAALEGIGQALQRVIDCLNSLLTPPIIEMRAAGGLSAAKVWQEIAANLSGLPVKTYASPEASARGAAMVALLSLGVHSGYEDFSSWDTEPVDRVSPDPATRQIYAQQQLQYQTLYSIQQSNA